MRLSGQGLDIRPIIATCISPTNHPVIRVTVLLLFSDDCEAFQDWRLRVSPLMTWSTDRNIAGCQARLTTDTNINTGGISWNFRYHYEAENCPLAPRQYKHSKNILELSISL